jgi:hypothetical protein
VVETGRPQCGRQLVRMHPGRGPLGHGVTSFP